MKCTRIVAVAASLMLMACGNAGQQDASAGDAQLQSEVAAENVNPVAFPQELSQPNCLLGRPNASRYPAPELVGVRLGMTRDEALAATHCAYRNYTVEARPAWLSLHTGQQRVGTQAVFLRAGDQMDGNWIFFATPGMPGDERVVGVWRDERLPQKPTLSATVAQLTGRFGAPSRQVDVPQNGKSVYYWSWGPTGQPLTGDAMLACTMNLRLDAGMLEQVLPMCGVTVVASLDIDPANPQLTTGYVIAMANPSAITAAGERMEQRIAAAEQSRQNQEASEAEGAVAPRF